MELTGEDEIRALSEIGRETVEAEVTAEVTVGRLVTGMEVTGADAQMFSTGNSRKGGQSVRNENIVGLASDRRH